MVMCYFLLTKNFVSFVNNCKNTLAKSKSQSTLKQNVIKLLTW